MKTALCLMLLCLLAASLFAQDELVISDFEDEAADGPRWGMGDSGDVVTTIEPRSVTDTNKMLKIVFQNGQWPGIRTSPPADWSAYEALRFEVWTVSPGAINVRIDDPNSTDHATRYNRTFKLEAGRNLCQIEVADIGRKFDTKHIKALILFTSNPPAGLTYYLDNVVLGALISEKVPFIPYSERKDLQPTLEVVTPHLPFARNLAGGPVAAFTMSNVGEGREISELMQRMDLTVSHMTWDRTYGQNTWGFGDFYGERGHAFDYVLMQQYLTSSLQGPEKFQVLAVTTPQGWERWTKGAREALLKRVKEDGEGLVLVFPFPGEKESAPWPDDLKELSALINSDTDYPNTSSGYFRAGKGWNNTGAWRIAADHPITAGLPLAALPTDHINIHKYETAPGARVLIETENGVPVMAVKQLGKGRVVTFAWRTEGSLTPSISGADSLPAERPYRYWEPLFSLVARSLVWAAGRDLTREGDPIEVMISRTDKTGVTPDPAFRLEVWKDSEGRTTDWRLAFTPPAASPIKPVQVTAPAQVPRGAVLDIGFSLPQGMLLNDGETPCTAAVLLGERVNAAWRTLEEADPASITFSGTDKNAAYRVSLPTARVRQVMAVVRITVSRDGTTAAEGEAEVIVSPVYAAGASRWNDYEVLMWPVGGLAFLQGFEDDMMKTCGSTGVMETGWRDPVRRMRWARAGLRLMVHDFARRQLQISHTAFADLQAAWNKTGDRGLLVRKPSYADPEFLAAEKTRVTDLITMLEPFDPTNYITCDEPSLSSYSKDFDFDFHPANIEGFRKAMEAKFGTVAAFNVALNEKAVSWDAVHPPLTSEAKKAGQWGLWNEWRAYNDDVMAAGYRHYQDLVTAVDPNGTISISGTQLATPFDGFDWYKLSPYFGTMQGYGYAYQDNKRMSFNPAMLNAVPAGYGRSGRAVDYQVWSKLCDHGGGHVIFWWIAFRNPDLTLCRSGKDYQRVFAEMQAGMGKQYMQGRRQMSPVGILYSMNSMRAAYTETGESRTYSGPEGAVTAAAIAAGYDPVFIADQEVAAGALLERGIKVLLMPMTLALGYGEKPGGLAVKPALEAFTAKGGRLIATHIPKYDEFLQPHTADAAFTAQLTMFDTVADDPGAALAGNGCTPWVGLTQPDGTRLKGTSTFLHRLQGDAEAYIVTILREPVGSKEVLGADGVVHVVPDSEGGRQVEPLQLDLTRFADTACYDMRGCRRLEPVQGRVTIDMQAGDGFPVALLPYTVDRLHIKAVRKDRMLTVQWKIEAAAKAFAPHVVRIEAANVCAEGRLEANPALCTNGVTAADGTGSVTFPLSLEDAGCCLVISARDILTGSSAEIGVIKE